MSPLAEIHLHVYMRRPISEHLARRSLEAHTPLLAIVAAQDTLFMMRNHPTPSGKFWVLSCLAQY